MSSFEDSFRLACPNILGNEFIPYQPHPKQALALGMHLTHTARGVFHMMYGGAAGGG